jgi:hypothetical protein
MANERQFTAAVEGGTSAARTRFGQAIGLAMSAGATVSGQLSVPQGSWITSIRAETATAFSGSPTHINLRVGNVAAGQQLLADVDVQAQGEIVGAMPATYDRVNNNDATLFFQLAALGGTNPAGTCNVLVEYFPPVA